MNHDCGKFTYEYIKIYELTFLVTGEKEFKTRWCLSVDKQSEFVITYCPFCGKELSKSIDAVT